MLFNSLEFLLFFPVVFLVYWLMPARKNYVFQNPVLFAAGYIFYGAWDPRFLLLLMFSTLLDFVSALMIENSDSQRKKRFWLWTSVCVNLGFLGVFKYYDFFAGSFSKLVSAFGFKADPFLLNIILPVGISFYTFHGLSYIIDVYYQRTRAERNFLTYAVFICFFPLLVAGPIERSTHLLPQLKLSRKFEYSKMTDGLRQILWGFFKKIVIADSCSGFVNMAFDTPGLPGSTMVMAAVFFAIQIYCDFSGYSDIAMGVARMFGIEVLRNFSYPYFSRDIAEFWRRWHISLSSWFRDYVYIPLGGSRGSFIKTIRNVFIIFLLSGLWHGANFTFLAWGGLHALYFLPLLLTGNNRKNLDGINYKTGSGFFKNILPIIITFMLVCLAWVFFRSESITHAADIFKSIFSVSLFDKPELLTEVPRLSMLIIPIFFMIEWLGRHQLYPIRDLTVHFNRPLRWMCYYALLALIIYFSGQPQEFIYFQF